MVETTNITPVTIPSTVSPGVSGGNYAPALDVGSIVIAFIPVIIFAAMLYWGFQKKTRKKTTVEVSYNLIAIEALVVLFLPLCRETVSCAVWAALPIGMFIGLVAFIYHRKAKEKEHKDAIKKAAVEGHIKTTVLVRETMHDDLKRTKEKLMGSSHKNEVHAVVESPKAPQKEKRWLMWKKEMKTGEKKEAATEKPPALTGPSRKHWLAKYAEAVIARDKATGKAGPSAKPSALEQGKALQGSKPLTSSEPSRIAPSARPAASESPSWRALERRPLAQLGQQAVETEPATARRDMPSAQPGALPAQRRQLASMHEHNHREQVDHGAISDLVKSVLAKKKEQGQESEQTNQSTI